MCEAPRPSKEAYASFTAYKKPSYTKSAKPLEGIYHSTFLSIYPTWIVDSGATCHMTPNIVCFSVYTPFP